MESPSDPEVIPSTNPDHYGVPETATSHLSATDGAVAAAVDKDSTALWPSYCNPSYRMPERIDVKVTIDQGDTYYFPVVIEKATDRKIYLGGYRNKMDGSVYHHATSQTPTDRKKVQKDYSNLRTRETQTSELRTLSVQPARESGTQMERIDLKLDNKRDTVKFPKPYFTADELMVKKKAAVIEIQRSWRGCMARSLATQIRQRDIDYEKRVQVSRESEEVQQREERVKAMARRTHPKTNDDFAALYNELDQWRRAEVAKIKATVADPEQRKAAMAELLVNETKALQGIQKLKMNARDELQSEKTQQMLQQMSRPHQWQLSRGETALVHTPETQRAKELLDLFNALNQPLQSAEQRLDVLLNVKWTVKGIEGDALTREIMELVDREADLLNRGRPLKSMESLRARISNLFLRFLENPEYNPRAADFLVEK